MRVVYLRVGNEPIEKVQVDRGDLVWVTIGHIRKLDGGVYRAVPYCDETRAIETDSASVARGHVLHVDAEFQELKNRPR